MTVKVAATLDPMAPFKHAKLEIGVKEIAGKSHAERVLFYHTFTSLKATDDETPWCSSFMCAMAALAGFKHPHSARARDWLKYGVEGDGSVGDIAVFTRGGGGHVAFVNKAFDKEKDTSVQILGGNQGNKVSVATYPKDRLLAFRRFPSGIPADPRNLA